MNGNEDLVKDHLVIDSKNRNGEQNHRIRGWRKHAVCNCQWHVVKWISECKQYHCVGKNEFKAGYNMESMLFVLFKAMSKSFILVLCKILWLHGGNNNICLKGRSDKCS